MSEYANSKTIPSVLLATIVKRHPFLLDQQPCEMVWFSTGDKFTFEIKCADGRVFRCRRLNGALHRIKKLTEPK